MQTEGLVNYNNAIVTEHYNPSVSLALNTFPYTGKAYFFGEKFFYKFGSPVQGEPAAVRQTEGLVRYNNVIIAEHYNPSVSLALNTFPYTGNAERGEEYSLITALHREGYKNYCMTTPPPRVRSAPPLAQVRQREGKNIRLSQPYTGEAIKEIICEAPPLFAYDVIYKQQIDTLRFFL